MFRTILTCLVLLTSTLALTRVSNKLTPVLRSSKEPSKPLLIQLTKNTRSLDDQRKLISFIQSAVAKIKSASFLQEDFQPIGTAPAQQEINLPLENSMNTQYTGKIAIGSKSNVYEVVFDTGSTAFFLNSDLCEEEACLQHNSFNPKTSKTLLLVTPEQDLTVQYGSGTIEGILVNDDIYLGDFRVPQTPIFLMISQIGILENAQFDGVLGLGRPEEGVLDSKIVSLFDVMSEYLPEPYFSFHLRRNDEPGSYILFGGINMHDMASELVWHDVIHAKYWTLRLNNVYVGDKKIDLCQKYKCGAVIDSGTSILTAPTQALYQMEEHLGNYECIDLSKLSKISYEIDNHKYELTPDEYILTIGESGDSEFYNHSKNIVDCSGVFAPMDLQTDDGVIIFILGDSFLTKYNAVFDTKNNRVGMALQKR